MTRKPTTADVAARIVERHTRQRVAKAAQAVQQAASDLDAENAMLRAALEPFAAFSKAHDTAPTGLSVRPDTDIRDHLYLDGRLTATITLGHLRAARRALRRK